MDIVLAIHSMLRWAIVALAGAALVKFNLGWQQGGRFDQVDRALLTAFSAAMDLQALLGLMLLVWAVVVERQGFFGYRLAHTGFMLAAVAAAHLPLRWRDAEPRLRYRNSLFAIGGALVLILLGVAALPGGWS